MRWSWIVMALAASTLACPSDRPAPGDDDDSAGAGDDDSGPTDDDDSIPGDDDTGDDDVEHDYECHAVGSAYTDGFFALREYQGRLYAGLFGYGHESQSMLYAYPPWELTSPGLTGISESVCALLEWNGWLYANTESSADIMRSTDGSNWTRVYDGPGSTIGCGLEAMGSYLYAVNYGNGAGEHGRILRTADGTSWDTVWDSGGAPSYIREITSHDGVLYAYYVDEDTDQTGQLSSSNGTDWATTSTPSRMFRGHSWNGHLWLASTERGGTGVAGVWRSDGGEPTLVYSASKKYVTEITHFDGRLFAGTSDGWKDDEGTSSLLMSPDGSTWETVCEFPEIAAWSIAAVGDHLYAGTWQYEHGGQVYEVSIVEVPTDDDDDDDTAPVDCSAISAASAAWEVCETGPTFCAGVFTDGAGCNAYCAPSGLPCTARYGGEPGCQQEPQNPWNCSDENSHESDWCECGWK